MFDPIVSTSSPVMVVGGGVATFDDLQRALAYAPQCIAADGGAAHALKAGISPDAVIGDFDSIDPNVLAKIPADRHHRVSEQMSTDFEKVLMRVQTPLVLGVGFLGGRMDHELAALHALMAYAHQPCVLLGADQIIFLAPPRISLPAVPGSLVSLFPLGPVQGRSHGLRWPIDGLAFCPGQKIGTSNVADGPFEVVMDAPAMLMILPAALMSTVVEAFLMPDCARWPVRAV